MKQKILLIFALLIFSLLLSQTTIAQATVSSVKAIEIDPTQTVIITQTKEVTSCEDNTPSFSVSPLAQEGQAGSTLIYDLNIKNNDVGCLPRSFLITGQAPLVNGELWDFDFFIYGASRYPDGEKRSNFILDPQENPTVKLHVTSKSNWPSGSYLHYSQLNYGVPGEEINLAYNIKKSWTYTIISGTKTCPVDCICDESGTIKCPVKPVCEFPCVASGETCSCPVEQTKTCKVGCVCEGETVTCPVEPVCESPCVKSGDTCSCPALPTKTCKVGCICDDDTMKCPVEEPICNPPCTKSGDTCSCPVEPPTKTCPVDCICEGETITCPTEEAKPIEAQIVTPTKTEKVIIDKTEVGLSIKTEKASATTTETLVIEEDKLYLKTYEGNKQIKITPEEASSKSEITTPKEIEIKEETMKPIYSVTGTKDARILFIIPVSMEIETKVDAETGDVFSINKPWWSFLAW